MRTMKKTYDTKCYELADFFFDDEPEKRTRYRVQELAEAIQQTIEDYFEALPAVDRP
jgi:hypothetical protein